MWVELETRSGLKKITVDPKPSPEGDLTLRNAHPDLPLQAKRATGEDRKRGAALYRSHRETCSAVDPAEREKWNQNPSWVREPEGY